jgi:hypothetical protein
VALGGQVNMAIVVRNSSSIFSTFDTSQGSFTETAPLSPLVAELQVHFDLVIGRIRVLLLTA